MKIINLTILFLLLFEIQAFGQFKGNHENSFLRKVDNSEHYWGEAGLGLYSAVHTGGFMVHAGFIYSKKFWIFRSSIKQIMEFSLDKNYPNEKLTDYSLQAGFIKMGEHSFISITSGLSCVDGTKRGEYLSSSGGGWLSNPDLTFAPIRYLRFGIPYQISLGLAKGDYTAVSFDYHRNTNKMYPYNTIMLTIHFGKLGQD